MDVGGLQQRIAEEADRRQVALGQLVDLLLVGRHPLQPGDRHHHLQQEEQLRVLRHERLHEQGAPLRIDAGRDPVRDVVVGVLGQPRRVGELARQGVPVGGRSTCSRSRPADPPTCRGRPPSVPGATCRWDASRRRRGASSCRQPWTVRIKESGGCSNSRRIPKPREGRTGTGKKGRPGRPISNTDYQHNGMTRGRQAAPRRLSARDALRIRS